MVLLMNAYFIASGLELLIDNLFPGSLESLKNCKCPCICYEEPVANP